MGFAVLAVIKALMIETVLYVPVMVCHVPAARLATSALYTSALPQWVKLSNVTGASASLSSVVVSGGLSIVPVNRPETIEALIRSTEPSALIWKPATPGV
jgi:hypothetical protein